MLRRGFLGQLTKAVYEHDILFWTCDLDSRGGSSQVILG
jgi:hypothetical protein